MVTPRLTEAQRGSSSPQSQQRWFPGPLKATPSAAGLRAGEPGEASPPDSRGSGSLGCREEGRTDVTALKRLKSPPR